MNKSEFTNAIAEESQLSKKDSKAFLAAFEKVVKKQMEDGGKIQLVGFGNFESAEKKEREVRNPQTNKMITVKAHKAASFKFSKAFKDALKNS